MIFVKYAPAHTKITRFILSLLLPLFAAFVPTCLAVAHETAIVQKISTVDESASTGFFLVNNIPWIIVLVLLIVCGDLLFAFFSLRKRHDALQVESVKRELLLNSVAEGVYGLDLEGNCTFCNAATLKVLGYQSEAELVGRNIHDLIHHTHADGSIYLAEDCKACLAYKENMEVHLEDELLWRSDGTSFQAEYWAYPIRQGKRMVGAVVSFIDVTERKEVDARLLEANKELDAFVYTVSHDLRTPISAVIGYADLIKEVYSSDINDEARELLTLIETQGNKMAILVEDLLALATAGNLESPIHPINVKAEVDYVVTELQSVVAESGLKVLLNDLPDVRVPATLLVQIFENLIGNALRYAGPDGGPVEVGGERQEERVLYYVRDHGRGIPAEEHTRIFDVFFRGTSGKKLIGSGVGLATVQKIARLYGGRAWIEETEGGGATFWIEMVDREQGLDNNL